MRILGVTIGVPLVALAAFIANLYLTQESIIFAGERLPSNHEFSFDLPFEEINIPVDGAQINALHFRQSDPRGLIFFLHGNGGNLESWTSNIDYYRRVNYDLFILDYRGYGKSTGRVQSQEQLHTDIYVAWEAIASYYTGKPIVIYGRSLGAALAADLATRVEAELVILVSPFTSMVAMARLQYPFLPQWLVRYPLRTDDIIADIRAPLVLVHGDKDRLIPLHHSRELKSRAEENSHLLIIEGAGHNDIHQFRTYIDGLTSQLPN